MKELLCRFLLWLVERLREGETNAVIRPSSASHMDYPTRRKLLRALGQRLKSGGASSSPT
ncbi:MAG: hypothetical protein ABMA26_15695 [Limisphaerales bacterium]